MPDLPSNSKLGDTQRDRNEGILELRQIGQQKPHKLTKLREAFSVILDETTGSANNIIVDEIDLQWGVQWKQKIEELIQSCDGMISILTPSYFNSRMCIYEFKYAIEHGVNVYPLYFREAKNGLRSSFTEEGNEENIALNKASLKTKDIQYRDFRKYKNKDFYCKEVQYFLDRLANEIA